MDRRPCARSSAQSARHALPGREYPDAAVPLGDRRLQYAALYDLQAGQGGGPEHPQRLRFVSGLLLETVHPPQGDPQKDRTGGILPPAAGAAAAIRRAARDALLPGLQHRPDGHARAAAGTVRRAYDPDRTERLLGRSDMRGAGPDAGGAVVALSHPARIRQQGVLFTDARPDRLPRKTAVSGGRGILHDTSPRSHAQHGASGASEPSFWLLLRRCRLHPRRVGRRTYGGLVRCDAGLRYDAS